MSWMELSLDTTTEAVDWVYTLLASTKYSSDIHIKEYQEKHPQTNIRASDTEGDWRYTINLYLPNDAHVNSRKEEIYNLLSPLERTGLTTTVDAVVVEEKAVNTEALNMGIPIGKRFVILSPETPYTPKTTDEITLIIKKSLAFGCGLHPTTTLCIKLIERHILPTMNVLDLGSGSGILSVAMAKLGAQVLALDNDSVAVESTQDAVHRNGVEQQVTVMEGSLGCGSNFGHWMGGDSINNVPTIQPTGSFDLIVANVLARLHVALIPEYRQALRRTGTDNKILITSGFTSDYEETITTALEEEGFELLDCERLNEWVALVHQLK